jgi:SOS-response transcriptional repressor LexA
MIASPLNSLAGLIEPMQLSERIKEAIGERKPADVARYVGVTDAAVTHWLNGATKSLKGDSATKLEALTGYRASWLISGRGPKLAANVEEVDQKSTVPLISWVQAGSLAEVEDTYIMGDAEEWIGVYDSKPGKQAFALRVNGDSMTSPNPGDRSFPEGTILIVDPSRAANAGDFVIAKDVTTQQATFKRLAYDGGRWFLRPLNPSYPTIEIDDPALRIIGRVIEYQTRGKL